MRAPSKNRLIKEIGLTEEQAETVRALIRGEIKTSDPRFKRTQEWLGRCYHRPSYPERLMECLNETIQGHGVECLGSKALYINTGDTYSPTLLLNTRSGGISITTLGDFIESNGL
jgi:hypothetical protein